MALMFAAANVHSDCLRVLVERGADLEITCNVCGRHRVLFHVRVRDERECGSKPASGEAYHADAESDVYFVVENYQVWLQTIIVFNC